ncbi:unnamed protein product [Natator depressus]
MCPVLVDASRTEFSAGSSTIRDGQPFFIPQTGTLQPSRHSARHTPCRDPVPEG